MLKYLEAVWEVTRKATTVTETSLKKKQKKKLNFVPLEVFLAITGTMILAHVVPSRRGFLAG